MKSSMKLPIYYVYNHIHITYFALVNSNFEIHIYINKFKNILVTEKILIITQLLYNFVVYNRAIQKNRWTDTDWQQQLKTTREHRQTSKPTLSACEPNIPSNRQLGGWLGLWDSVWNQNRSSPSLFSTIAVMKKKEYIYWPLCWRLAKMKKQKQLLMLQNEQNNIFEGSNSIINYGI